MERRHDALETIKRLGPTLSLADLSRVALKIIRDQVGIDRGTVFMVDRKRGEIRSIVVDRVVGKISLPIGYGIAGAVADTGQSIDTCDPHSDPRFDAKYDPIFSYDTKDIYCMPILNPGGVIVGVLELLNRTRPFTPEDLDFLSEISGQLGTVLESASAHEQGLEENTKL